MYTQNKSNISLIGLLSISIVIGNFEIKCITHARNVHIWVQAFQCDFQFKTKHNSKFQVSSGIMLMANHWAGFWRKKQSNLVWVNVIIVLNSRRRERLNTTWRHYRQMKWNFIHIIIWSSYAQITQICSQVSLIKISPFQIYVDVCGAFVCILLGIRGVLDCSVST